MVLMLVLGCGLVSPPPRQLTPRPSVAETREAPREEAADPAAKSTPGVSLDAPSAADSPSTDDPSVEPAPASTGEARHPCERAQVGRDLRTFPTNARPGTIDLILRGDADELRALGGPGVVDVSMFPGSTVLYAEVSGPDARARCGAMVRGYLALGSGRRVIGACTPCE
jgi:hypothetical protein